PQDRISAGRTGRVDRAAPLRDDAGMPIEPDTKDWTWVLERACPECGVEAAAHSPATVSDVLGDAVVRWEAVLRRPDVAHRPDDVVPARVRRTRPGRVCGVPRAARAPARRGEPDVRRLGPGRRGGRRPVRGEGPGGRGRRARRARRRGRGGLRRRPAGPLGAQRAAEQRVALHRADARAVLPPRRPPPPPRRRRLTQPARTRRTTTFASAMTSAAWNGARPGRPSDPTASTPAPTS